MSKTLVIVESPAKAKMIGTFLGPQYIVKASVGHIRDLPKKSLGVDLDTLKPTYEVTADKKATVAQLRKAAKTVSKVILATDPDREGEAIAWHIKAALGLQPGQYVRVAYGEITETAIRKAMQNPRELDMDRVAAQEARRVIDRLIGYLVSPALSQQAGKTLSAGRVQSVAVRLVVDREREIQNFTPQDYYDVSLKLSAYPEVTAGLILKPWAEDQKHLWRLDEANRFCGTQSFKLVRKETKAAQVKPRPPLTTVTLQGLAEKLFGMTAAEAMAAAQKLFDQGLITYHRTDNPYFSDEGYALITEHLQFDGIPHNPERPTYPSKASAQEAHEAIRPTDVARGEGGGSESERQLYSLIRERALCVGMKPGVDHTTQMLFESTDRYADLAGTARPAHYLAKGKIIKESGWRQYAVVEPVTEKDTPLPDLNEGASYEGSVTTAQKQTKPPGRYTSSSLTKTLEAAGIGRPATYASIIENIKGRSYIIPEKKKGGGKKETVFVPGPDGFYVVDALINMAFLGYRYTQQVEGALDEVAAGKSGYGYLNVVRPMYQQLKADIDEKLDAHSLVTIKECPLCSAPVILKSKRGKGGKVSTFWVHKSMEQADVCGTKFLSDRDGEPVAPDPAVVADCPRCSAPLVQRSNDRGAYWVHQKREQADVCGVRFFSDVGGVPVVKDAPKTAPCVLCGDTLKRCFSKKRDRHFWVHTKKEPECGSYFVDDEDGVPMVTADEA